MTAPNRFDQSVKALIFLAQRKGSTYRTISAREIAEKLDVSRSLVAMCGSIEDIRKGAIKEAIETPILELLAQAIVAGDPMVAKLDSKLRFAALASLS